MKASLAWINRYLDRSVDAQEAATVLTRIGFPVEEMEQVTTTAGVEDMQLDVEVTSNRSDVLSHIGVAREIAAATQRELVLPDIELVEEGDPVDQVTSVENHAAEDCPVYTARVIRGVKVGPSPTWMADHLEAAGLRTVNNVVDITNYVLLEMGQPLHAFDMARLAEGRIVVRHAMQAEPFIALNESKHELQKRMLVIADARKPQCMAGIMGGLTSEVTDATTDVLLESARFDPLSVRRTSRKLKLASDSSYRYERGVDPRGIEAASRRATALIVEYAGGTLCQGVIRVGEDEPEPLELGLNPQRCRDLLGIDLSDQDQVELLAALHFSPRLEQGWIICTIPTYRLDLLREVDLIEEVARLHGLDQVPIRERIELVTRQPQESVKARRVLGQSLTAHGYHETVTPSFLARPYAKAFLLENQQLMSLIDERRKAESDLRPSLLPSLMVCRKANQDAGNQHVKLYEVASTWLRFPEDHIETRKLAMLSDATDKQQAVREVKSALSEMVERLAGRAAMSTMRFEPTQDRRFTAAATIIFQDQTLGLMGLIARSVQDVFDLQTPLFAAEIEIKTVLDCYPPTREVTSLPRFPGIERDLSIVVDETVTWAMITAAIEPLKLDLLEKLDFVTVYRGKPIVKGRKSVSLRLLFRDPQKTLRHDAVDAQVTQVVDALKNAVTAELRQ